MTDKCVNNFMGFCDPSGEYAVTKCQFQGPYIEETHPWKYTNTETGKKYLQDKSVVRIIVHFDILQCNAKSSDLIEMFEDCMFCNGKPEEYIDPYTDEKEYICPVDYPEECPYKTGI